MVMITQEYLKSVLFYNPASGLFRWRKSIGRRCRVGGVAGTNANGYVRIKINGKKYFSHSLAWLYVYGRFPSMQIDHINGDKKDNRISNLRDCTLKENRKNRRLRKDNTSGVNGVVMRAIDGKWIASAQSDGVKFHIGVYDSVFDAAEARARFDEDKGFHKNHGKGRA